MGERSSICCVGARSTLHEQQTHQKLGRARQAGSKEGRRSLMASEWQQTSSRGILPLSHHHIWGSTDGRNEA
jgi:hypothetical protein